MSHQTEEISNKEKTNKIKSKNYLIDLIIKKAIYCKKHLLQFFAGKI